MLLNPNKMVERLQRLFVDASKFSVWIVDSLGDPVVAPLFSTLEGERVYEKSGKRLLPLTSQLLRYGAKEGPILIDCDETGWQVVVTLFRNEENDDYYLCTGPVRIDADKQKLVEQTEDLRLMLASYYKHERMDDFENHRGELLDRLALGLQKNGLDEHDALEILLDTGLHIDFAGYASKGDHFQYRITHTSGRLGDQLHGGAFFAGEGYLGQVAVTGLTKWWVCTSTDPRTRYFLNMGIDPSTLFAFPVKKNGEPAGLLFYGFVRGTRVPDSQLHIHWGSLVGSMLGEGLTRRQLQEDLELQLGRIKTLKELASVLTTVGSLKRVMYVLVDMSLTLVAEAQASICLVRTPDTGNIQIVSRGFTSERADRFGKLLAAKHFPSNQSDTAAAYADGHELDGCTESAIEFKNEVMGVICIVNGQAGLSNESASLLDTLAAMGATVVERSISVRIKGNQTIDLLYESMLQLDPAKAAIVQACRELAGLFARYLHLSGHDIQRVDTAAMVLGYDPSFLRQASISPDVMEMIEEYHKLGQMDRLKEDVVGRDSYTLESKILFYTMRHIINAGVRTPITSTTDETEKQFHAFLTYREAKSRELATVDIRNGDPLSEEELQLVDAVEFAALSPRELEVLTLISRGSSNRRIAEALYISEHTVKNHITNIFSKLGVTDRSQLIAMAYSSLNRSKMLGSTD